MHTRHISKAGVLLKPHELEKPVNRINWHKPVNFNDLLFALNKAGPDVLHRKNVAAGN